MISEQLNTLIMVLSGIFFGTLGTVWVIRVGLYAIFRPFIHQGWDRTVFGTIECIVGAIENAKALQAQIQTDGAPRSASALLLTTAGLILVLAFALWLGPIRFDWLPFLMAFISAEFVTIGFFELSRVLGKRKHVLP